MKQICIGILAHVDAGKTTLSEALLYCAGAIRRLGIREKLKTAQKAQPSQPQKPQKLKGKDMEL